MGAESKTNGAAAPSADKPELTAGSGEFSREVMGGIFAKFGQKLPGEATKKTEAKAKEPAAGNQEQETPAGTETPEEKTAREAAGQQTEDGAPDPGETETDEQKAARETAEAEAAATAEDPEAKELNGETERIVKAKLKDLPEPQRKIAQSIINERIGAISAKSKAEAERLSARVVELTGELEAAKADKGPVVVQGIHPALLAETPEQIDRIATELDQAEDLLEPFRDTGIEADEDKGVPAFSPAQVRERLREIARERERMLPKARELLQKRAEAEAGLKTTFPAIFDPRTEEYRAAAELRKQLPELRRMPDAAVFVAKFVLGSQALAALAKPGKQAPAGADKKPATAKTTPATRKAPRAPGDGSAALGSVLDASGGQQPDADGAVRTFTQNRSRENLKGALRALVMR